MVQKRLAENPDLQSIGSWVKDVLANRQKPAPKDVLCHICATFNSCPNIPYTSLLVEPFELGTMSDVRARVEKCPLCRVAFHVVSQALAHSQAEIFWPGPDLHITLQNSLERPLVCYGNIRVGTIALYPRTLSYRPNWQPPVHRLSLGMPGSNFGLEFLRSGWKFAFGIHGIVSVSYSNLCKRTVIHLSSILDIKSSEFRYYSTLPTSLPAYDAYLPFLLRELKECEESDSRMCGINPESPAGQLQSEILLIDVAEGRIVKTFIYCQKYLALSYVWGSYPMFKTTQKDLASLQESGAFSKILSQLPRILQDAMDLTRHLGERYLWCDALCIVQDDIQFKHSQIANMSAIYGQAFLTICALSGSDASAGLLGFGQEAPGGLPLDTAGLTKECTYVSFPSGLQEVSHLLPYETRAWTLQERLLSKRCLLFTATHVYFQCQLRMTSSNSFGREISTRETLGLGHVNWDPLPKSWWVKRHDARFRVENYLGLVEKYTQRQLTYPEDIINAFAAISSSFEAHYSCRIHKGIPVPAFIFTLCWVGVKPLRRRSQVLDKPLHPSRVFPSWSWIGWEGPISFLAHQFVPNRMDIWSYVPRFLLEEKGQFAEAKHGQFTKQHPDCCQTPIPVSPTGHPSMLHFMAYCVDSKLFHMDVFKDGCADGKLYPIAEDKGDLTAQKARQRVNKGVVIIDRQAQSEVQLPPSQVLSEHPGRPACGMLQLNTIDLRPASGIITDCIYVLLSSMHFRSYRNGIWSCGRLGVRQERYDLGDHSQWALSALLLARRNEGWERVGIAVFNQEAWSGAGPQERYIQLI